MEPRQLAQTSNREGKESDTVPPHLAYHTYHDLDGQKIDDYAFMCRHIKLLSKHSAEDPENIIVTALYYVRVFSGDSEEEKRGRMILKLPAVCSASDYVDFCHKRDKCGCWKFLLHFNADEFGCRLTVNIDGSIRKQELVPFSELAHAFPDMPVSSAHPPEYKHDHIFAS